MGVLDDFLRAHVSSGLLPGEQIIGWGHARCPMRFNALGVPQLYAHWLAVATSSRLILFNTEADGMFGDEPRPLANATEVWNYDEIARVEVGQVEGLNVHSGGQARWIRLFPHPTCGPAAGKEGRYDIFPAAKQLDEQPRFHASFPQWIQAQVAAGAFPMPPEKRAMVEARIANARAEQAVRDRAQNESVVRQAKMIESAAPLAMKAGATFVLAVIALIILSNNLQTARNCLGMTCREEDAAESHAALMYAVFTFLALLGILGVGGFFLRRDLRARKSSNLIDSN